jgi:hypothetical protein
MCGNPPTNKGYRDVKKLEEPDDAGSRASREQKRNTPSSNARSKEEYRAEDDGPYQRFNLGLKVCISHRVVGS